MTRFIRRDAPLWCALLCIFLNACNGHRTTTETAVGTPEAPAAAPLPEVGELVRRMTTQDGCKDFTAEMLMTSEDEKGKRDQVEFKVQRKYAADKVSTFLIILSPREETDKAFLAIEKPDQATEAFSYLAGLKRLARMNSDRQLGFRGARVSVQELLGMELNQYTHGAAERATVDGKAMIKVDFKEKPERYLAYPRIVGYFMEKDLHPSRFELFDSRGELQKVVEIAEVKDIQDRQTITDVKIEDLLQKLKLRLETRKVEYDRGLADNLFTENHLKSFISSATRRLDQ